MEDSIFIDFPFQTGEILASSRSFSKGVTYRFPTMVWNMRSISPLSYMGMFGIYDKFQVGVSHPYFRDFTANPSAYFGKQTPGKHIP